VSVGELPRARELRARLQDYRRTPETLFPHGIMDTDALLLADLGDGKPSEGLWAEGGMERTRYIGFVDARSRFVVFLFHSLLLLLLLLHLFIFILYLFTTTIAQPSCCMT
jgi:hypothetical protein